MPELREAESLEARLTALQNLRDSAPLGERRARAAIYNRDDFDDFLPIALLPTTWDESEGSEWDQQKGEHVPRPLLVYKSGGDRTLSFTLLLDETVQPVEVAIRWLQEAMRPQALQLFEPGKKTNNLLDDESIRDFEERAAEIERRVAGLRATGIERRLFNSAPTNEEIALRREFREAPEKLELAASMRAAVASTRKRVLDASRYTPKRLFLVRGDDPIPFYGAIDKLLIREELFLDSRVFRASVDVSMFELIESESDFRAAGYQIPPIRIAKAAANRLTESFEEGRTFITSPLGIDKK